MALVKFEIPPRMRRCCLGNEDFLPGMEYISLLEEGKDEKYFRKDFCQPCWKEASLLALDQISGYVHWKSQVPLKTPGNGKQMKREFKALELLREIIANGDEEEESQAFVLALLLVRGKKIQLKQEITEDGKGQILLYEVAETEEMLAVKKVNLSAIQTVRLQQILALKLGS